MEKGKTGAIILAGGHGRRMHSRVQKQYMLLAGRPLILHTLEAFENSPVDEIVLVVGSGEEAYVRKEILAGSRISKLSAVVAGGRERYHSVYEGLKAMHDCAYVLIHDGARPLVTEPVIRRAIQGAVENQACVVGMPVKDTIKVADAQEYAVATPDRSHLWQIQTPQAFAYRLVREAYDRMMADPSRQVGITDDAMVVENGSDVKVRLIEGSYENLKVTTPEDLILAEALLQARRQKRTKMTNSD